ncbi:glycosyltransferase family 4 protein [Corynebacterium meridianum]|uniref:Undecaprenyl/decaprenyl-phosphate alpha-N-acetylglucosaminyl 1-phosphate transferase n=1 Tax=Corynebacterium meridianum TaxID=2765363 RepID=A0A934M3W5_9CORY|nr:MraY family glycosyltransferase [Corynebacterium meridianum]MBI8988326.1 undecaprenyl/decaprenyl-phosphate alpha-N-acetylglucosaminyl 1-phosphate transferase [Corynebacterium meridianum]MCK7678201.1 undecaprenyl/decaprenyl-phosphate alpha-N-acetylglucosaminyl 1-phosphate transferase [Corynebacterium meridianum]
MGAGGAGVPLRELGLVLLVACAVTYLTTGIIRHVLVRAGKVDPVRERDVHKHPTPQMGGVAMFTGFLVAVFVAQQLPALNRGFQPITPEMGAVVCAGFVIVMVGILDDFLELDALTKLIGQTLGAVVMSLMGLTWTLIYLPFGGGTTVVLDQVLSTVLTAFVTVSLINALNFVDGSDGLAAGVGMITGGAILTFALTILHDQGGAVSAYPPAIIGAGLVGVCLGFLPHNFAPARIFMGDTGSMLIGLLLAAASTSASGKINLSLYGVADVFAVMAPVIVAAGCVCVPLAELFITVVRRLLTGQSMAVPDKNHLHHQLMRHGHTPRQVALAIYLWTFAVAFGAVAFTVLPVYDALFGFFLALVLAFIATIAPVLDKRSRDRENASPGSLPVT